MWKSAGRAPSLRVLPWHLSYNWGKMHGKTSIRVRETSVRLRETSVRVRETSVRLRETSVRVRETSVRLRETSVRVQYTYYQNTHTLQKLNNNNNNNNNNNSASSTFLLNTFHTRNCCCMCLGTWEIWECHVQIGTRGSAVRQLVSWSAARDHYRSASANSPEEPTYDTISVSLPVCHLVWYEIWSTWPLTRGSRGPPGLFPVSAASDIPSWSPQ